MLGTIKLFKPDSIILSSGFTGRRAQDKGVYHGYLGAIL